MRCSSVNAVFQHFLDDAGWPFDNFACGNLVNQAYRQLSNRRHSGLFYVEKPKKRRAARCSQNSIVQSTVPMPVREACRQSKQRIATIELTGYNRLIVKKEETEPLTRIFEPRDFVGSNKVPLKYRGVQHDSWTATYANPDFYQWLFAQQRTEN